MCIILERWINEYTLTCCDFFLCSFVRFGQLNMADNLSQKSHKTSEKNKYNNVMHRTTSESLRLNDTEKGNNHPTSLQSASHNTRKISSFQITSVTVGSRVSTDAGEDSADDLDESHTDDISRITDLENETPSFSEDTFSKDDVFYNASSASLGCAPVIPTSSQYGLAIVGQDGNNPNGPGVPTLNNTDVGEMHVSVTNSGTGSIYNIIGNPKPAEGMKEIQEHVRNERFKVVKIESTEPFRRGRWMCMDYLDHTTTQPSAPIIVNNNVDCQTETSTVPNVPDSGVVLNDGQHEETVSVEVNKPPAKDLQVPNTHQQLPNTIASPGQSLTQPLNMMQQNQSGNVSVQSPPLEIPQQINQSQGIQGNQVSQQQQQAQSMSHPAQPTSHPPPTQPQSVQQMPQSFPSHQLQQVIAQSQGIPQMQQMQMHQQLPPQQMQQIQNQQAQIQQQMQGQHMAHNPSQMPNIQQMQQMPQMQQLQNQGQIQQMPGQQAQIQQIQMQQMSNQQVPNQPLHQMHNQQAPIQNMPQQGHHMQNQQSLPNQQQPQMQHMQNQTQMHPMQNQQSHQIQSHMQQMQQMPQMNSQGQGMPQMHNQPQMHQMSSQQGQVNNQGGQVQQQNLMHPQLQQNMSGVQHNYNTQPVSQAGNPQNMMQQQIPNQPQHMTQQTQVSQPLVQTQHSVPQYYQQQSQLNQQGQSLTQEVMANIVNSQQGATLPNNIQGMSSQSQGATLPANLQGLSGQQTGSMHPINQAPQSMPQNTIQMMTQAPQNIPMSMDSNQSNMQIPVSDPIYMQNNVNQQMPLPQHIGAQQAMLNQQVTSSPGQGQSGHISQQSQMPLSHVMPSQQGMNNQAPVPNQGTVMSQTNMSNMQNVPIQQNQQINQQMPQVSNVVQQPSQPMMQNMVAPNQQTINQNVIQHGQNIPMSMQQNHPGSMQGASVHSVSTSVVQSQTSMHPQVGMPIQGGFNSQGSVGSMPQNVMPVMSQTNMTTPMGMQNVNNQMDIHISQQNICSTASATQPIMSGTNSPVVSLPVSSSMNYAPNPGPAPSAVDTQNFGSPVSAVVSHVVNSLVNSSVGLSVGEVANNDSGGGTPASDGAQLGDMDGKEDNPVQNTEENER